MHDIRILDLCTGSGNIAISLAKLLRDVRITASDISRDALITARGNAGLHACGNIEFVKSDMFDDIITGPFDIIVSNPPYVSEADWHELPQDVLCEPHTALYGGKDGLSFYREILERANPFLKDTGYLIMEIGYDQSGLVKELIEEKGFFLEELVRDYNGIHRIAVVRKSNG